MSAIGEAIKGSAAGMDLGQQACALRLRRGRACRVEPGACGSRLEGYDGDRGWARWRGRGAGGWSLVRPPPWSRCSCASTSLSVSGMSGGDAGGGRSAPESEDVYHC